MQIQSMLSIRQNALPLVLALCTLLARPSHSAVPTVSIGAAFDIGGGIEYAPYEGTAGYSALDPTVEFGLVFNTKHRVSMQYMLNFYSDKIILPKLSVVSNKFTLIYGYQFTPRAFIGPHCFMKFGRNQYEPFGSGLLFGSDQGGFLRDKYTYLGGGATFQLEPLKHLAIQLYTDINLPIEHARTNNVEQRMPESSSWQPVEFPSGKRSYFNMGMLFSVKF